jgi:hypothetical protein
MVVIVLLTLALGLDRTFFVDEQNYLDNFTWVTNLHWLDRVLDSESPLRALVVGVFSEEVLWQVWVTGLGSVLSPPTAVIVTVAALNLLLALAVVRLPDPVFPLIIWIILPVGFAVTGLLQLRQGFAFAVVMFFALRLNRPVLGILLAAAIHATFALALPFAIIAKLCGRKRMLAISLAVGGALMTAYLGGVLFEVFGGRRLKIYSVNETEATSILYVFGALLCSLPSLHRLLTPDPAEESAALSKVLANVALVHVGVIAFVVCSYFVFPLGAGRVGYLIMLLLIPIVPTMRPRSSPVAAGLFAAMVLYLVYLTTKTALEGTYDVYFAG